MLYLAQIPHRIGFRQSSGWFFFHHRAARDPRRHDVERNLSVLQLLRRGSRRLRARPRPAGERCGESRRSTSSFAQLGVGDSEPVIGINPGSVWPTKRWSPSGFAELIPCCAKPRLPGFAFRRCRRCAGGQADRSAQRRRGARIGRPHRSWRVAGGDQPLPGLCHQRQRPDACRGGAPSADRGGILRHHAGSGFLSVQRQLPSLFRNSSAAVPVRPMAAEGVRWCMRIAFARFELKRC